MKRREGATHVFRVADCPSPQRVGWVGGVGEIQKTLARRRRCGLRQAAVRNLPGCRYGIAFSQLHAVELVDVDGDGLKDIVTGKCFWAHGPTGDPDPGAPAVLYWFRLVRTKDGSVDWVPHVMDLDSGVGRQIGVADVNGDGRPDFIVGNKKGTFVFLQEARVVSREVWEKAQPPVRFAAAGDKELKAGEIIQRTGPPRAAPPPPQPARPQ